MYCMYLDASVGKYVLFCNASSRVIGLFDVEELLQCFWSWPPGRDVPLLSDGPQPTSPRCVGKATVLPGAERPGQGEAWQGRAGQGRAGQGRAGQG